jgi:hypothetical protein
MDRVISTSCEDATRVENSMIGDPQPCRAEPSLGLLEGMATGIAANLGF